MLTQEEILKGNEAIALFLKWRKGKDNDSRWGEEWFNNDGARVGKILNFSNEWNWLMPVVGKAVNLADDNMWDEWSASMADVLASFSMECVFMEVVDFIEWYETNKE